MKLEAATRDNHVPVNDVHDLEARDGYETHESW